MSRRRPVDRAAAGGRAAPWVVASSSLVVIAQLRGLVRGPEGELVWNTSLTLLLVALALANVAVWRLVCAARRRCPCEEALGDQA